MRALLVTPPGHPEIEEVPDPAAGPGQVLLRVLASAVNPVDAQTAAGVYHDLGWIDQATVGLGWDAAAEVVAVGPNVDHLTPGDRVAALHPAVAERTGTHAELVAVDGAGVAPLPEGLDPVAAATVPLNALTAAQALDLLGAERGSLLVTGAAGGVGGYALVLARRLGYDVIGLARSDDRAFVEGTGTALVAELTGSYDAVLDTAALGDAAVAVVRDGGRYVGVLPPAVPEPVRGVTTQAVVVSPDGPRLGELLDLAAAGVLEPRVAQVRPLAEGGAAVAETVKERQRGRVVLVP